MARTLTAPAAAESVRQSGAAFLRILEVQYGGGTGTLYYSDQTLATANGDPVNAEARVIDWGQIQLQAEPGNVGGYGSATIVLADPDLSLDALFRVKPGVQNRICYVHLYFDGTTWPDDRVTIFGGILTTPMKWSESKAQWSITLKGLEAHFDRSIGQLLTRVAFPEINCSECEGEIFPIVYGNPCYRVPCCPIQRPGKGYVGVTINPQDDYLYLAATAQAYNFTVDETITIVVGYPGNQEIMTGCFCNALDRTQFTIYTRDSIQAEGTLAGIATDGGDNYVLVPEADFVNPTVSRRGYLILFLLDQWYSRTIDEWWDSTVNRGVFITDSGIFNASGGEPYKVSALPGTWKIWPPGVPVYERGPWTYIVNFLPSQEVVRVEARGVIQTPSGDSRNEWMEYNEIYWEPDLNNKDYNVNLGRHVTDDPGVTTVTINASPTDLGFEDIKIYVTVRGCTDDNTESGAAIFSGPRIIWHLLGTPQLGGIDLSFIDEDSIDEAEAEVVTTMGFALLNINKLHELCSEIAFQCGCLYFWDQGLAVVRKLKLALSEADVAFGASQYSYASQTLSWEDKSIEEFNTQVAAKFRQTIPQEEQKLLRESTDAIAAYGKRLKELDLWCYQFPSSVALMGEFWLEFDLEQQREISFDTFLVGLNLQPGDTIVLNIFPQDGVILYQDHLARVKSITHTAANALTQTMEKMTIVAELKLFDWAVDAITPIDGPCGATIEGTTTTTTYPPTTTTYPPTTTTTSTTTTTTTTTSTTTTEPTTTTTTTTTEPTTTTTTAAPCVGGCGYFWQGASWYQNEGDRCGEGCPCLGPPEYDGTYVGQYVSVPCSGPPTTTTTTSTTTTTTDTPTTTTTSSPCNGSCALTWSGTAWVWMSPGAGATGCTEGNGCACDSSGLSPGTYFGQVAMGSCGEPTTTTSTTSTTTTSTTSTTTTTTAAPSTTTTTTTTAAGCGGTCRYTWDGSSWYHHPSTDNFCTGGGCVCSGPPGTPGSFVDENAFTACTEGA